MCCQKTAPQLHVLKFECSEVVVKTALAVQSKTKRMSVPLQRCVLCLRDMLLQGSIERGRRLPQSRR